MNDRLQLNKSDFDIRTLDDEIRVDGKCRELLREFYMNLLDEDVASGEATNLASGADYYTRDFVIGRKQRNILEETPGIVRQFAGNWYITSTLEPNIRELAEHLSGVKSFYRFLHGRGLVSGNFLQTVENECDNLAYYEERIDSFWKIEGDGYFAWEKECSLKNGES